MVRICADLGVVPDWTTMPGRSISLSDIGAERWAHLDAPPPGESPPAPQAPNGQLCDST
jgi:hypothetical protein